MELDRSRFDPEKLHIRIYDEGRLVESLGPDPARREAGVQDPDIFTLKPSEYTHLTNGPAGGTSSLASWDLPSSNDKEGLNMFIGDSVRLERFVSKRTGDTREDD